MKRFTILILAAVLPVLTSKISSNRYASMRGAASATGLAPHCFFTP